MTFYYIPALKYSIIAFIFFYCAVHILKYTRKSPYYLFLKAKLGTAFGNIGAQVALGGFYYQGIVVKQDLKKAISLFQNAAERHSLKAYNWLGHAYQDGKGGTEDKKLAFKWFLKAAEQGDAQGQFNVGMCYCELGGIERNEQTGMMWLEKAANQDYVDAANNLAMMYWNGGTDFTADPLKAFPWFLKLANQGEVHHQNIVGCYYLHGFGGFQRDAKIAVEWFKKTAKQGDAMGEAVLGWLYHTGQGVKEHTVLAARYYRRALNQQATCIEFNFGLLIQYGIVNLQIYTAPGANAGDLPLIEGGGLYTKAADKGHAKASYQLGTIYENGPLFLINMKKAIACYEKAAAQNIVEAQQRLQFIQDNNLANIGYFKHYLQTWKQVPPLRTIPDDLTKFIIQ